MLLWFVNCYNIIGAHLMIDIFLVLFDSCLKYYLFKIIIMHVKSSQSFKKADHY